MTGWSSCPGWAIRDRPLPPGTVEATILAVSTYNQRLQHRSLFGALTDYVVGVPLDANPYGQLQLRCDRSLFLSSETSIYIDLQWADIWGDNNWYEVGWHPINKAWDGLVDRRGLFDAINPGKRYWSIHRPGGIA